MVNNISKPYTEGDRLKSNEYFCVGNAVPVIKEYVMIDFERVKRKCTKLCLVCNEKACPIIEDEYDYTHGSKYIRTEFPQSRYQHCHGVGKKMYAYAKDVLGWDEELCKKMFVLGCLHDIGYELDPTIGGHGDIMSDMLSGYEYADEIRSHTVFKSNPSKELALLYYADATVDGMGNWCTYEDRRKDTINRYGKDSSNYTDGLVILEYLKANGYDDSFGL